MKTIILLLVLTGVYHSALSQKTISNKTENETAIRRLLEQQVLAWNRGNIEEFMTGYQHSDSILFVGSKITSGWDSTLIRYKRSYPNKAAMGQLRFEIFRMDFISSTSYLVTGRYFLTREKDNPKGIFTLLFRKINEQWSIVYDHTS